MKRTVIWIAVVAVLAAAGAFAWKSTRPKPIEVELARVDRGAVETTVANTRAGTVKACRRARLAPHSGGQIARMLVREGDRVQAGQLLLELWNQDLREQRRLAQEQLGSARSHAQEACIVADNAQREAVRTRKLREAGFVSAERSEQVEADAKARRAACDASGTDVRQAEARIGVAAATLDKTQLRAPFAGIVAELTGETGEYSTPSPPGIPTPPAVDLIDDSCLYVTAPMDEIDTPKIRADLPARITLDAYAGRTFAGHVKRVAPYVVDLEKQARTVDVEVGFDDPKSAGRLLVGYSADVEIILDVTRDVSRIPTRAILEGGKVLVFNREKGIAEERKITTGAANWQFTQVLSGLASGDEIVLSLEKEGVKAGAKVAPSKLSK